MTLPELPTDNLYKFMSIFGLLLFFSSYYFPWIRYTQIQPAIFDLEVEVSISELEHKYLLEDLDSLDNNIQTLEQEVDGLDKLPTENLTHKSVGESEIKLNSIKDKLYQLKDLKRNSEKKTIILSNKVNRLEQLGHENKIIGIVFLVISTVGFILSVQGLKLWYQRLQGPLDKRLSKIRWSIYGFM